MEKTAGEGTRPPIEQSAIEIGTIAHESIVRTLQISSEVTDSVVGPRSEALRRPRALRSGTPNPYFC